VKGRALALKFFPKRWGVYTRKRGYISGKPFFCGKKDFRSRDTKFLQVLLKRQKPGGKKPPLCGVFIGGPHI